MDSGRTKDLENILDNLYQHWQETRRETIAHLGEKEALKIIDFHANNWIDIVRWVSSEHPWEEQMNIVNIQFLRVFKEIYWLQFLFYTGNYPTAYRNLRYIWEMMSQAYYVDTLYPGSTLDEQFQQVREMELRTWGWNVVASTLCKLLHRKGAKIQAQFKPLWDELNRYVHPSTVQMDLVAEEEFSALVTDSFSESLAKDLQKVADRVLDIVYSIVLKKFAGARRLAQNYEFLGEWEECLPNTISIIKE